MVVEVNKLLANVLLAEHAVSIPGVGSLRAVRRPAERLSRRRIRPAYYTVEFTSGCVGTSLADAIAAAARCDAGTAQDACARWLSRTSSDGVLTIRGVGVLRGKNFAVDPAFEKLLNPQGREPFVVRKPVGHWMLWAVATVAIVCGLGVCGWIVYDRWASGGFTHMAVSSGVAPLSDPQASGKAIADVTVSDGVQNGGSSAGVESGDAGAAGSYGSRGGEEETAATPIAGQVSTPDEENGTRGRTRAKGSGGVSESTVRSAGQGATDSRGGSAGQTSATTVAGPGGSSGRGQEKPSLDDLTAERLVSGRTYVVLGVYSNEQNARRAARQAAQADPGLRPALYFYGPKFMLSVFASEDAAAGAAFVRAHATRFPDAWCYTAR